jgi:energy-coupling factor transport system ATP-binding protein
VADDSAFISIRNLGWTYAATTRPALSDINVDIHQGEYVGIIGLNGAGKTTLGLCLNGIVPHMLMGEQIGTVTVAGLDPTTLPVREMARTVGMVFDNPEFQMSQITAAEEVALGLENIGVPYAEMVPRIAAALDLVGLTGFDERSPMGLSGGQQQRLAIAATLVMKPTILFMDEPTSNLDPLGKEEVFEIALKLNKEEGLTVIVAEHEVEVLAQYADRILVLHEGQLVLQGTPAEVFAQGDRMTELGLRVPQVTDFARALAGPAATGLPVTTDGTLAWLGARA